MEEGQRLRLVQGEVLRLRRLNLRLLQGGSLEKVREGRLKRENGWFWDFEGLED